MRITIGGNRICYPWDVGTRTAPLELVNLVLNSVLSRKGVKFATFDISNFYLCTPLDRPKYVRIHAPDIPDEFADEYHTETYEHEGWVYFEIRKGVYGLPQAGTLANQLLEKRLSKHGYYQCPTTPGLWQHKWRPIVFCLIVNDFGVEYVGERHAKHLRDVLQKYYTITENLAGDLYAGININWDYRKRTCRLSMRDYVKNLLLKHDHPAPRKPQLSPHRHTPIRFGATQQFDPDPNDSAPLNIDEVKHVQSIVGALLYYARAVDNKLLVALSDIKQEQSKATELTQSDVKQLLDYVATYPNDGIVYQASDMVLAAHSNALYLNASNARSRRGAHIMLSKNDPIPAQNGPVLTIARIIKFVMSSAAEAELAALYDCAKEMVPLQQALIEMGWPQPKSPIQTNNFTAVGVTNKTIVPKQTKSMDMRFHWLRCRESQGQFRFYWAPGSTNLTNYSTKHHPPLYHEAHQSTHAGLKQPSSLQGCVALPSAIYTH